MPNMTTKFDLNCSPARSRGAVVKRPGQHGLAPWLAPRVAPLVALCALLAPSPGRALEFGPFSLTGFAKVEATRVSDYCPDCQLEKNENKQRFWADELVQGKDYGAGNTHVTLFQPYLGAKFDLPRGFKVSGLLSQRWRDGKEDFKG